MIGYVKESMGLKGFGVIMAPSEFHTYLVHYSNIISQDKFRTLFKGQKVEFTPIETARGFKAVNVEVIND